MFPVHSVREGLDRVRGVVNGGGDVARGGRDEIVEEIVLEVYVLRC